MYLSDCMALIRQEMTRRIRNGELTERALARATGVSQPHIHNLLKGERLLTARLADEILRALQLTAEDLVQQAAGEKQRALVEVPLLAQPLGPGYNWLGESTGGTVCIRSVALEGVERPLAARLAADEDMEGAFVPWEVVVLDRSRLAAEPGSRGDLFVVRLPEGPRVRRLRIEGGQWLVATEKEAAKGESWGKAATLSGEATVWARVVRLRAIYEMA
jgi:transcriptional regulator with XRE-family HTH domain